jgi:cellulose synthase/poly-beta-1,6-N-acetylglucosamine synthase-like glycosyltransferase
MEVLYDKWFWTIVISVALIIIIPLIVIWIIFYLPPELKLVATICIVILWGVVSGYKDWVVSKRKSEEEKSKI